MALWYNVAVEAIGHSSIFVFLFCLFWYLYNLSGIIKIKKFKDINKIYFLVSILFFLISLVLILVWITLVTSPAYFTTDEFTSTESITLFITFGAVTFTFSLFLFLFLLLFEQYFIIYEIDDNLHSFSKKVKCVKLVLTYKQIYVFKINKLYFFPVKKDGKIFKLFIKYSNQ